MKRRFNLKIPTYLAVLVCSVTIAACANQGQKGSTANAEQPAGVASAQAAETPVVVTAGETAPAKAEQQAADAPLYTDPPKILTPAECAACHKGEYNKLRASNSKHRFECTDCHELLHSYVPTKNNYAEIMPKCSSCHDLPHGAAFTQCLQCHKDPHTPLDIPFSGVEQKIKNKAGQSVVACEVCHYDSEGKEMETYPCKHNTNVGCTGCHADKHGVRPSCFDCHEPHVTGQTYADCLVCHRPHSAKNILPYPEEIANNVCASCHTQIYNDLQSNHTKHTDLQCAACHVTHGQIPKCQKCHGEPHGAAVHKKFPNCLECHVDPHNLPVNPQS